MGPELLPRRVSQAAGCHQDTDTCSLLSTALDPKLLLGQLSTVGMSLRTLSRDSNQIQDKPKSICNLLHWAAKMLNTASQMNMHFTALYCWSYQCCENLWQPFLLAFCTPRDANPEGHSSKVCSAEANAMWSHSPRTWATGPDPTVPISDLFSPHMLLPKRAATLKNSGDSLRCLYGYFKRPCDNQIQWWPALGLQSFGIRCNSTGSPQWRIRQDLFLLLI